MALIPSQFRSTLILGVTFLALAWGGVRLSASAHVRLEPTHLLGQLVDPEGRPVVGARVELWVQDRLMRSTFAGQDGAFSLSIPTGVIELQLRMERLGFAPRVIHVDLNSDLPSPLRIELEPSPLALPGLRVEVAPERCPARSDAESYGLWQSMARRHPDGLDTLGAASYTMVRVDTLAAGAWGAPPSSPVSADSADMRAHGQRGFSGRLRLAWERRLERDGYAFPIRRTDAEGSYSTWSYAPLEADFSSHFGTIRFTEHQRLRAPAPTEGGGWILPFCPTRSDRAGLEGHLELSVDTLLLRVEWRFVTGEPDEDAGGWARFPTNPASADPPMLLPLESMIWRRIRDGRMQRRAQWYEVWVVTPGDSVPFLPERPIPSAQGGAQGGGPGVDPWPFL